MSVVIIPTSILPLPCVDITRLAPDTAYSETHEGRNRMLCGIEFLALAQGSALSRGSVHVYWLEYYKQVRKASSVRLESQELS